MTTLVSKSCYDFSENEETLINIDTLLGLLPSGPSEALLLLASQIDQLKLTHSDHFLLSNILGFDCQAEYGVGPARHVIQVV